MERLGFSDIFDPGGELLVRKAGNSNVENYSVINIQKGLGCLVINDSEEYYIDEPGRFRVNTGISPIFKNIQNLISKGKPTHVNSFYFYDTDPGVYRDIQFETSIMGVDIASHLQVTCRPKTNVSLRISDIRSLYHCLKGYGFSHEAINEFISNKVQPYIRRELCTSLRNTPLNELFGSTIAYSPDNETLIADHLRKFGLEVKCVHLLDLGISDSDSEHIREYYETISKGSIESQIIEVIAGRIFNGDKHAAAEYYLALKSVSREGGGGDLASILYLTSYYNKFKGNP